MCPYVVSVCHPVGRWGPCVDGLGLCVAAGAAFDSALHLQSRDVAVWCVCRLVGAAICDGGSGVSGSVDYCIAIYGRSILC